ncbi:major facilitator superfamily domain-containing protein [Phaeosphaeriaceae sp. PMI808]|nr:major facilitator superfamily domain-containing protein [Phaeosphaeriaceae sp. PMI808]
MDSSTLTTLKTSISGVSSETRLQRHLPTLFAFTALCCSIFLVALDTVLLSTALPTIARSLSIDDSTYAWVGSSYLLANAASVPFWGKLSDIFGRKSVLLAAEGMFLVGSVLCAISLNAAMVVTGRAVQGFGGGGIVVLVHVCTSDLFSIRDRSFYVGILGTVWAIASALSPVLGGVLVEHLSWRWCFYINLPIIVICIITLCFTLQLHNPRTPLLSGIASMDWLGTVTILTATILLLVGLQLGGETSFATPIAIGFIAFGSCLFATFPITQWWEGRRSRNPILPLRIFKDVSNLSALGVCACDSLAFNSVAYFLPLHFQLVQGQTPSVSGLYMLSLAVPLAIVSFTSGYFMEKTGRFLEILQAGLLFMTIGLGLLITLDASHDIGKPVAILIITGMGFGPNFGAPLIALQTRIQDSDIATGTAAFGFVRMIFSAIGVVTGQVIFQCLITPQLDTLLTVGVSYELAQQLVHGQAVSALNGVDMLSEQLRFVVRSGLTSALRGTWIFNTAVGGFGLLISFGIKRTKLQRKEDEKMEQKPVQSTAAI